MAAECKNAEMASVILTDSNAKYSRIHNAPTSAGSRINMYGLCLGTVEFLDSFPGNTLLLIG